jgi:hypothetical protein
MLFVSLAIYTYARMRTHVIIPTDGEKARFAMPKQFASIDSLTLRSPRHAFRVSDSSRSLVLSFSGLRFTLAYAAGEAVWYMPIALVLCLAGFFSAAALVRMELRTEEQTAEAAADTREAYL